MSPEEGGPKEREEVVVKAKLSDCMLFTEKTKSRLTQ